MDLPATLDEPPVLIDRPAVQTRPVVLASPHSGRAYPADFVAASRLDPLRLRRSEDSFVDELFAEAPALGMPLVRATFPRAWCDANREPWELDPGMFTDALPPWVNSASPRVAAGLGTIAKVVASGEPIYRARLRFAEAEARVAACWQPFHAALEAEIEATRARFGQCLLIDCHSMPSASLAPRNGCDIVLGDAHGTSCAPRAVRLVEAALIGAGFAVRRNDPYAGGYITRHYGRPGEGVHTLQVEISRGLYMDERRIERSAAFSAVRDRLSSLLVALSDAQSALN
jgi:N-formylglutamate amidohydrolase